MSWFRRRARGEPPSLLAPAERIVGAGRTLVTDGERVDHARDYEPLVREIEAITGGVLRFDAVSCEEIEPPDDDPDDDPLADARELTRELRLTRAGRTWTGRLQGETDWIDGERLLGLLNRVLADLGGAERLHELREAHWGQEMGVVFARDEHLQPLRDAGYVLEADPPPTRPADEVLDQDRVIHGQRIRAGAKVEYWADPPFDEMEVTLAAAQELHGLLLPAATTILYREDGRPLACVVTVAHQVGSRALVAGTRIPFEDGAWQLDQAEAGYD
jgi:hypothetical protein